METIKKEIENLENINSWSDKMRMMKQIREQIKQEQNKMDLLLDNIINDKQVKKKNKMSKKNMDELISEYNNIDNFDEKLKVFYMIKECMTEMESLLFS